MRPAMIRANSDDAEDERRDAPPVDENPADVERHRGRHQDDAEDDEEGDRLLPPVTGS